MSDEPKTIRLDEPTQAFYKGVGAGSDAAEALTGSSVPYEQQVRWFWLSVGIRLAASGLNVEDERIFEQFIAGANTHQPSPSKVRVVAEFILPADHEEDPDEFLSEAVEELAQAVGGGMRSGWNSQGGTYSVSGLPF